LLPTNILLTKKANCVIVLYILVCYSVISQTKVKKVIWIYKLAFLYDRQNDKNTRSGE